MKVIAFIDGLNLYHSLKKAEETKRYKWLNLRELCNCFIKKSEMLTEIFYFTALTKWDTKKIKRHKKYIKALETQNVQVVEGVFQKVTKQCRKCYKIYKTYEEKRTDVNIALHLLKLSFKNKFEKFILLTGDSDLVPAVEMIKNIFPKKKSHIIIPVNGYAENLKSIADNYSQITISHLKNSVFPNTIKYENETISKPDSW